MTAETSAGPALLEHDVRSIVELTQQLVRVPSRGGLDDYQPVIHLLYGWLQQAGLRPQVLQRGASAVAVFCDVDGRRPGPHYVLDACLDTADVGDPAAWARPPFSGDIEAGWLHGRGSSDSKAAVAIFSHLALELAGRREEFAGRLTVLFDLDEHTGGFAGIRSYLPSLEVDGVLIGYPGPDEVIVGGRGFYRATILVHGVAAHVASRSGKGTSAITRAVQLKEMLEAAVDRTPETDFGLGPALTVTGIRGGTAGSWSVVPDRCELDVDVRLTPRFDAEGALALLRALAIELDAIKPVPRATDVLEVGESWPSFRLDEDHPLVAALIAGARSAGLDPTAAVAGPSNIGCLLAAQGIPATAGFGVICEGMHATNERIRLDSILPVYSAYRHAVLRLLR